MSIWFEIKQVFRRLTPRELATRELVDAELARLQALTAQDYAAAISEYNEKRARRLREYLASLEA